MEIKELKVIIPDGYEIDEENSTFKCIKFRPAKQFITYEDVARSVMDKDQYFINALGEIHSTSDAAKMDCCCDKCNSSNIRQLERILALNQLLNIAEYYNRRSKRKRFMYNIMYDMYRHTYDSCSCSPNAGFKSGVYVLFNRREDLRSVIDNPNFRDILDIVYKNQIMED